MPLCVESVQYISLFEKSRAFLFIYLFYIRHPQLRSKTLLLYLNWFTNALVYYGLALNSGGLVDDFYLAYMVNGAMEIPAYTVAILLLIFCGRRIPYATTLTLAGEYFKLIISSSHCSNTYLPRNNCTISILTS